jgi:7-alpha-hydroxysteroid dehydrogenase
VSILDRFLVTDQVAIITGAGRGIGAGCAKVLAEAGAHVTIAARTPSQLEDTASAVRAVGREALVIPTDVNSRDAMTELVERTKEHFGRIDIVVNNAGGTMPAPFLGTSEADFEGALRFNVTTAFNLSQLAVPHLLAGGGGAIVNISSVMGHLRDRGFVAYGTAKAALHHLTRLLAADLAPRIRVNAIAVGSTATSALEMVLANDALREAMIAATPLKRIGTVEDIALGVLYLASPAGGYITGKVLEIDGGTEAPTLSLGLPDL